MFREELKVVCISGIFERLGQGDRAGDENSLCAFENEHALCSSSTNEHVENENIDALGNSVDHIVICWLSITARSD